MGSGQSDLVRAGRTPSFPFRILTEFLPRSVENYEAWQPTPDACVAVAQSKVEATCLTCLPICRRLIGRQPRFLVRWWQRLTVMPSNYVCLPQRSFPKRIVRSRPHSAIWSLCLDIRERSGAAGRQGVSFFAKRAFFKVVAIPNIFAVTGPTTCLVRFKTHFAPRSCFDCFIATAGIHHILALLIIGGSVSRKRVRSGVNFSSPRVKL